MIIGSVKPVLTYNLEKNLMLSQLGDKEKQELNEWLEDQSFVNWAKRTDQDDMQRWELYFNLNPSKWHLAKMGRTLALGIPFREIKRDEFSGRGSLNLVLDQLNKTSARGSVVNKTTINISGKAWLVAATVALMVLASIGTYYHFFYNPAMELVTNYGQQLDYVLPDGSKVNLNANSNLTYYKQEPRTVWLNGEAYFEVEKKPQNGAKFQVITQDLSVTVLGTSFNVNTRNDKTKVYLTEGKVTLKVPDYVQDTIEMHPGDLISYSKKLNDLDDSHTDASALEAASWKEGALIFKDRPLMDALFEIEDIYGIQFIIRRGDLLKETISGGVPINDLQVTINTLTEVYGIRMNATGKRYFITDIE